MRYLHTFALFESIPQADRDLNQLVWDHLQSLVTFPALLAQDEAAWAYIVTYQEWESYLESEAGKGDLTEEEYLSYQEGYHPSDAQISFDDFVAALMGYTELPEDIVEESPSVDWYMSYFNQPRPIASMMKAMAEEDLSQLEVDPEWES